MTKAVKAVVPLRRSLRRRVGVLVSGAVLLVGVGIFLFGFRPMVGRIAEAQFALTAAQVEANLNSVFAPAEQILTMSRGWIGGEAPELASDLRGCRNIVRRRLDASPADRRELAQPHDRYPALGHSPPLLRALCRR